jgi:hypothetical protein
MQVRENGLGTGFIRSFLIPLDLDPTSARASVPLALV